MNRGNLRRSARLSNRSDDQGSSTPATPQPSGSVAAADAAGSNSNEPFVIQTPGLEDNNPFVTRGVGNAVQWQSGNLRRSGSLPAQSQAWFNRTVREGTSDSTDSFGTPMSVQTPMQTPTNNASGAPGQGNSFRRNHRRVLSDITSDMTRSSEDEDEHRPAQGFDPYAPLLIPRPDLTPEEEEQWERDLTSASPPMAQNHMQAVTLEALSSQHGVQQFPLLGREERQKLTNDIKVAIHDPRLLRADYVPRFGVFPPDPTPFTVERRQIVQAVINELGRLNLTQAAGQPQSLMIGQPSAPSAAMPANPPMAKKETIEDIRRNMEKLLDDHPISDVDFAQMHYPDGADNNKAHGHKGQATAEERPSAGDSLGDGRKHHTAAQFLSQRAESSAYARRRGEAPPRYAFEFPAIDDDGNVVEPEEEELTNDQAEWKALVDKAFADMEDTFGFS